MFWPSLLLPCPEEDDAALVENAATLAVADTDADEEEEEEEEEEEITLVEDAALVKEATAC